MIRLIKSMDNLQRRKTPNQLNRRTSNTKDEDYVEEESASASAPEEPQSVVSTSKYTLIENLCWILGAMCCIYVSDIFTVLFYDDRINRSVLFWLHLNHDTTLFNSF
jgi:hypothetical protein